MFTGMGNTSLGRVNAVLAQLEEHLDDTDPHVGSSLVRDPAGGFKWWRETDFPDIDPDYLNGTDPALAHERDRLLLEADE